MLLGVNPKRMLDMPDHDKTLPFEPLVPNAATVEAMEEARRGKLPQFAGVEDLFNDLRADDPAHQTVQTRLQRRLHE